MSEIAEKHKNRIMTSAFMKNDIVETVNITEETRNKEIKRYINMSRLPRDYRDYTFEKSVVTCKREAIIKAALESYCKNFNKALADGTGIYMFGNKGTGKTFYSICIFNELSKRYKVYRTSLNGIYNNIKNTFSSLNNLSENDIYKDLFMADLIIIDDLGKENISETWGKPKLYEIFNFLYEQKKCVIISTNLDTEQMKEYTDMHGSDAIVDRFRQMCEAFQFDWKSRRSKKDVEARSGIFECDLKELTVSKTKTKQ